MSTSVNRRVRSVFSAVDFHGRNETSWTDVAWEVCLDRAFGLPKRRFRFVPLCGNAVFSAIWETKHHLASTTDRNSQYFGHFFLLLLIPWQAEIVSQILTQKPSNTHKTSNSTHLQQYPIHFTSIQSPIHSNSTTNMQSSIRFLFLCVVLCAIMAKSASEAKILDLVFELFDAPSRVDTYGKVPGHFAGKTVEFLAFGDAGTGYYQS